MRLVLLIVKYSPTVVMRFFMIALLSLSAGGCSAGDIDVDGSYVCVYPYGVEVLVLKTDGSYKQLIDVDVPNGSIIHDGKWVFSKDKKEILLIDAVIVDDNFGALRKGFRNPTSGTWALVIKKRIGSVSLYWNPDFDYEFSKLR